MYKREKARFELILNDYKETHKRRLEKYNDDQKKDKLELIEKHHGIICSEYNKHQDYLACAFYLLSENIANHAKFQGVDIDDAIQEGVLICFEKVDRFNPKYIGKNGQKAKAFNYMTTCIYNHLRQLYRSQKNYSELKKRVFSHLLDQSEFAIVFKNGQERMAYRNGLEQKTTP